MADSAVKLYFKSGSTTQAAASYTSMADIPSANAVGLAKSSATSTISYAELGATTDSLATKARVFKNGRTYAILNKHKVIAIEGTYPNFLHKPMDGEDFYSGGYAHRVSARNDMVDIYVTFPGAGNYKVNFQADEVRAVGCGAGTLAEYSDSNAQGTLEIGYQYRAFYGLRLTTAAGTIKWIAVANNYPSGYYINHVYSFSLSAAEAGTGSSRLPLRIFLGSRNGHYWSEYGTYIYGATVLFDFA